MEQYPEGVDELTVRKVPWHLLLCKNNPIKGGVIIISYICHVATESAS